MFYGANDHPRHATEVPTCPVETWSPPKSNGNKNTIAEPLPLGKSLSVSDSESSAMVLRTFRTEAKEAERWTGFGQTKTGGGV